SRRLDHSNGLNKKWLIEFKSHLNFMNKLAYVVRCHGITLDPNTQDFMLVLNLMECSLREYLLPNHKYILWEQRIRIVYDSSIRHYSQRPTLWGYIAPEILNGKQATKESDIYSFAILAYDILEGIRPPIDESTPCWYIKLMKQCWDAIPENRPNTNTILNEIRMQLRIIYQNDLKNNKPIQIAINNSGNTEIQTYSPETTL
ncbi:12274_t:CDS:2, partial [Racocetra persica]